MWQQRFDAKRKLKKDAVPTIFGFFLKKKNVDNNVSNNPLIKNNKNQDVGYEISLKTIILQQKILTYLYGIIFFQIIMNTSESSLLTENNDANDDVR